MHFSKCSFPQTAQVPLVCIVLLYHALVYLYLEHYLLVSTFELKPQVN